MRSKQASLASAGARGIWQPLRKLSIKAISGQKHQHRLSCDEASSGAHCSHAHLIRRRVFRLGEEVYQTRNQVLQPGIDACGCALTQMRSEHHTRTWTSCLGTAEQKPLSTALDRGVVPTDRLQYGQVQYCNKLMEMERHDVYQKHRSSSCAAKSWAVAPAESSVSCRLRRSCCPAAAPAAARMGRALRTFWNKKSHSPQLEASSEWVSGAHFW